ncbi:MAG: DUF2283 domain-containing protein [Thermodesulfobacteriota bacterium]
MWIDYDKAADVLYINFKKPQKATDAEMLKNGILIRHRGDEVVGLTILEALSLIGDIVPVCDRRNGSIL